MSTSRFLTRWGASSHVGCVRRNNEDSFLAHPPVFLVADGMGGHSHGKEASRAVVEVFKGFAGREWFETSELSDAVRRCHQAVLEIDYEGHAAPGSTLAGVALAYHGGRACWFAFNVGDSRIYRLRGDRLEQISVDHSRRQELLDAGLLDPGVRSVEDHVITRAIGAGGGDYRADQWIFAAATGDRLLLCSDGLTGEVGDDVIAAELSADAFPSEVAQKLVDLALRHGGRDNVTVVVVDALEVSEVDIPPAVDDETVPIAHHLPQE